MADYIDKNILCQAYVHVDLPEGVTPEALETIKGHLKVFAESRAKFFVYPEVIVDVEFKDGSLKSYLTVAGIIVVAISQYGDFRGGIDALYSDIKRLSESMVSETLFMTKSRPASVRRTEARTGVIGNLKVLIDDMATIETSIGHVSVDEVGRRVKRLKEDAERLLENVKDGDDYDLIEFEMDAFAEKLPEDCPHPREKIPDDSAIISYQDARAELRKRFDGKAKKRKAAAVVPIPVAPILP